MALADRVRANKTAKQKKIEADHAQLVMTQSHPNPETIARGLSLGAIRSIIGSAQGISGLYDLVSNGKGTNRFSNFLDKSAKTVDEAAEGSTGYKAAQFTTDLAQLIGTGGLAGATKLSTKAADKIAEKVAPLTEKGLKGKSAAKAIESLISPSNITSDTAYNVSQIGQDESKNKGIDTGKLAMNIGGSLLANPVAGAAGAVAKVSKDKIVNSFWQNFDKAIGKEATDSVDDTAIKATDTTNKNLTKDSSSTIEPTESANETPLQRRIREKNEQTFGVPTPIDNPANGIDEATLDIPAYLRKNPKALAEYKSKQLENTVSQRADEYTPDKFDTNYSNGIQAAAESKSPRVQSSIADAYGKSGAEDSSTLVAQAIAGSNDKNLITTIVNKVAPKINTKTKKVLINKLQKESDPEEVKRLIYSHDAGEPTTDSLKGTSTASEDITDAAAGSNKYGEFDSSDLDTPTFMRNKSPQDQASATLNGDTVANVDVAPTQTITSQIGPTDIQIPNDGLGVTGTQGETPESIQANLASLDSVSPSNEASQALNGVEPSPEELAATYPSYAEYSQQPGYTTQALEVKAPTMDTLSDTPEGMQQIKDIADEGDIHGVTSSETPVSRGGQYISDQLNEQVDKLAHLGLSKIDSNVTSKLTTGEAKVNLTKKDKFYLWAGKHFLDSQTFLTRTIGKTGSDLIYNMINGAHFKSQIINELSDTMAAFDKGLKKAAGGSNEGRVLIWNRIADALDDRTNAASHLINDQEKELYGQAVAVFDRIKELRDASNLPTIENYSPWNYMKLNSQSPEHLAESITGNNIRTESKYSQPRTATEREDLPTDVNLYSYVSSQLNEMAFDAPIKKFKADFANLPAGIAANRVAVNEALDYAHTIVQDAIRPPKGGPSAKLMNNVYRNILRFNGKLAIQNATQRLAANTFVTKEARNLVKELPEDLKNTVRLGKDGRSGLAYGDSTITGELMGESGLVAGRLKKANDWLDKMDFYAKSEGKNVKSTFDKGVAQAILDSEIYKSAIRGGASKQDAAALAIKDDTVREIAARYGNTMVNNTQFGANAIAKPLVLRNNGQTLLGIPLKTFTMFARFPIGMSQNILETLGAKNGRALDVLRRGDPRASGMAEFRMSSQNLASVMEDTLKAVQAGVKKDIPEDVLKTELAEVKKNIGIIDEELKNFSHLSTGKGVKNLTKMWVAAATIQFIYSGGMSSDDPTQAVFGSLIKSDPTAIGRVFGQNSPLLGVSSSLSPVKSSYGKTQLNENSLYNFIPVVGGIRNRAKEASNWSDALNGIGQ